MPEEKNMFESLRLSAGGGLNSAMEKVAQAENTATIAIGIGGTGKDAIKEFKQMVYERVKQDNYDQRDKEIPKYGRIKFLVIDSDDTGTVSDLPSQTLKDDFMDISVSDIVNEIADEALLNSKKHLDWFSRGIKIDDASKGAGGTRQVGRYLLSKRAEELKNRLKEMVNEAVTDIENCAVNVYIMAGIAGGTGSGCFVDVCYIMRKVLTDLKRDGSANIMGFFFLPDVNIANPHMQKGGVDEDLLKKNGYAAMKELDYLMNIPHNGDVFQQAYSETFDISLKLPPVKMCHLLSATDVKGKPIKNGYKYAMNVVAEYCLNFVVESKEVGGKKDDNSGITLKGIQSNISAKLPELHKNYGANYVYHILGASCATVPYKEIGTYLAIRFFDSIKYIQRKRPQKPDIEEFCRKVELSFPRLDAKIKAGTTTLLLDPANFDTAVLKAAPVGKHSSILLRKCEEWKDRYEGTVTNNITTLKRKLDSYNTTDNPESVIGKIFKELISIINDPELGPYFAAYMINDAQNSTIMSVLMGIRKEVENKRDYALRQVDARTEDWENAQTRFRSSKIDTLGHKKRDYVFSVQNVYANMVEISTYTAFLDLIDRIKKHLELIEKEFFKKLTGITDKLIRTFKDNEEFFNTHGMGNELYTWSIIDINSIKGNLDSAVNKMLKKDEHDLITAPYLVEKFDSLMLDNSDKWFDESETKIAEMISKFIRKEFEAEMSKSMKQYLQEKYGTTGNDLINDISDSIIKDGLVAKGAPIFHNDPTAVNLSTVNREHVEYIRLSIPATEADISEAAKRYKATSTKQMGIAGSVLTDRIFMLEFFSGIPMYAYLDLFELEKVYDRSQHLGVHLFEGKDKDWRELLPSPVPATYISDFYKRKDQQKIDDIISLYDRAVAEGTIIENRDKAGIGDATVYTGSEIDIPTIFNGVLDANEVEMLESICKSINKAGGTYAIDVANWSADIATTAESHKVIKEYLVDYKSNLNENATLSAYNNDEKNGKYTNGFDSTIRDDFAMKPVVVAEVKKTLENIDKLKLIEKIIELAQSTMKENNATQSDFIRALMHSVIVKARSNYKYGFDKRGETEEIILTEDNEEFESIPVYRAFISYQGLDDEIKDQIAEKTKSAARNVTDEMYDNIKAYQEFYKEYYKDYKKDAASGDFDNSEEIIAFLDELYDSIERFIRENK